MMTRFVLAISVGLCLLASGCKKDGGTDPVPETLCGADDFNFPAAAGLRATMYSDCQQTSVGAVFYVKLVLHNVTDAFGLAAEISFPANVTLMEASLGPAFGPAANVVMLGGTVANNTAYAFGVTYKAGTGGTTNGSATVVRLKCQATAAGTALFTIDPLKLEIKKSDGTPVAGFGGIVLESASVDVN